MRTLPQDEFQSPSSLDEAHDLHVELTDECLMIQAQLSNKDHRDENGRRFTDHEYHEWRARATWALAKKRQHVRWLKRWIATRKDEANRIEAGVANPTNVVELFGALLRTLRDVADWDAATPRHEAIIRLSEQWIRTKGAPAVVAAREKVQAAS